MLFRSGSKKLIIILAAVLVLVLGGGGAAVMLLKKKPAAEDGEDGEAAEAPVKAKAHAKSDHTPTFVPLDPFTVNLADKDAERYAQIGVTLELPCGQEGVLPPITGR